jgi:dolichol-phosphate mannosyltransferase
MQYDCHSLHVPNNERPPLPDSLISIVLPVYNESAVLDALYAQLTDAIAACCTTAEIIFVNDGSSDGSPQILDRLAAEHHEVRVVHFSRNFGHQAAVQAGLAHATGDAVVLMDSDMQDAPDAIARLLAKWQEGYDVVYAVRFNRKERWLKRCLFAAFHRLLAWVATTRIPADAGNFGLIDARVVKQIIDLCERDRYLPGLRSWVGFRQTGVAVERNARYDDCPRVSMRGLWRLAKTAIFSFSTLPLAIFYTIGYAALGLFLALTVACLYARLFTDMAIPGWTSHILSASFFGALNALGISMLGEYVIRIYDQVRGRPLYIIDRVVEHKSEPIAPPCLAGVEEWDEEYQDLLDQSTALLDMVRGAAPGVDLSEAENSAELLKLAEVGAGDES